MRVNLEADTDAYLHGMHKTERAMKKQRRRERARNTVGIILATILVGYVLFSAFMIATAAW